MQKAMKQKCDIVHAFVDPAADAKSIVCRTLFTYVKRLHFCANEVDRPQRSAERIRHSTSRLRIA